ncbi:BREX-1 system adenine-specific DNA-methyltransferase PglX [Clostridiaceae bacterium BL-3]|nr:BREX-1 system adenine-specific DNA-methyltransferase PglX [Clostridiaceae bacterium BL-3]
MDKNKIKAFAVWARENLIEAVSEKANLIGVGGQKIDTAVEIQGGFKLNESGDIFKLPKNQRDALVGQVRRRGFKPVMEEAAYTWFNRFMALRYMEVNNYLPLGVRILSSIEGKNEPDVLFRISETIEELKLDGDSVYGLLDSGKAEDREEAYKYILIKQCSELGSIMPQMFEKISDYTELLFPGHLLDKGSVIGKMVEEIPEDDWKEGVEIIGWMYQYYISEKKDKVFAALKKNVKITKENIPAATQLFTPDWIVKYMVENSLGRLWLEGHPDAELQGKWKYYIEETGQEPEVEEELESIREQYGKFRPEDIKVLDPCMGSGHILVYAFEVFYEIYKREGYLERKIPRLILENNLYGLDIDERAVQLASFALIMKARQYNRRLFRDIEKNELELNLCSIQESNEFLDGTGREAVEYFCNSQSTGHSVQLKEDVKYLIETFKDAGEYGSIIEVEKVDFELLEQRLEEIAGEDNLMFADYKSILLDRMGALVKQAEIMGRKYEICATNPPYLGRKGMNSNLKIYLEDKFNDSKYDLFSVFMEKLSSFSGDNCIYAVISQHSWMFLSSYYKLRKKMLDNEVTINMLHLGARTFYEIAGEVVQSTAFVQRKFVNSKYKGRYIRLVNMSSREKEVKTISIIKSGLGIYDCSKGVFKCLPGCPIAYWISDNMKKLFENAVPLGNIAEPKQGMATADNNRFTRLWFEVNRDSMGIRYKNASTAEKSSKKWFPYNKGGDFRKWYGNNEFVVNWKHNGYEIKNYKSSVIRNEDFYFKKGVTWSLVSTFNFAARLSQQGFLFDVGGSSIFPKETFLEYVLALMNSKITYEVLKIIAPTINFQVGDIKKIPLILHDNSDIKRDIMELTRNNIEISKNDWDSFETSWDFKIHPLLLADSGKLTAGNGNRRSTNNYPLKTTRLSDAFDIWKSFADRQFQQLKHNEEELNGIFIRIYGLQEEIVPEEEDRDVTVRKADRERDIKSFISYAVGCMFGRYSVDVEGLIYAGGEFSSHFRVGNSQPGGETWQVRKIERDNDGNVISDFWTDATFAPDRDNFIPITEDEYFEDDIVSKFIKFVKIVYGEDTLEENLDFIADSIGRKSSETARQSLRRYFVGEFYSDHVKNYKKRPIYWLFDSGKSNGFKALIYIHRYSDQTVAKVRMDYLHVLQRKYGTEIERQRLIVDSEDYSSRERNSAKKKIYRIKKQMEECREYDRAAAHLANKRIRIDLDEGVKANYARFQGVEVIDSSGKKVEMNLLAKI